MSQGRLGFGASTTTGSIVEAELEDIDADGAEARGETRDILQLEKGKEGSGSRVLQRWQLATRVVRIDEIEAPTLILLPDCYFSLLRMV